MNGLFGMTKIIFVVKAGGIHDSQHTKVANEKAKVGRGHTELNHGPIGLQPIALPLSYIPNVEFISVQ